MAIKKSQPLVECCKKRYSEIVSLIISHPKFSCELNENVIIRLHIILPQTLTATQVLEVVLSECTPDVNILALLLSAGFRSDVDFFSNASPST